MEKEKHNKKTQKNDNVIISNVILKEPNEIKSVLEGRNKTNSLRITENKIFVEF